MITVERQSVTASAGWRTAAAFHDFVLLNKRTRIRRLQVEYL